MALQSACGVSVVARGAMERLVQHIDLSRAGKSAPGGAPARATVVFQPRHPALATGRVSFLEFVAALGLPESDEGAALRPIVATVRAGEVLYLPALWWHAVSQRGDDGGATVAVNYWYEGPAALGDDAAAAAERAADKVLASARGEG